VRHRTRSTAILICFALLGGALTARDAGAAAPQLRLNLNAGLFLEVISAAGVHIRTSSAPGGVIPPGAYAVVVSTEVGDAVDTHHMFHLSGPGQNLQTDLLGGDNPSELYTLVLLPSSTYVFEDDRNPQLGRVVFSTSATGSADAGESGGSSASASSGSSSVVVSGGKSSNVASDPFGSKVVRFRGSLAAGVSTAGRPTLTVKGRRVSSLKAGRYRVVVLDETARSPFVLQRRGGKPVTLSGRGFLGRRTITVALAAGQWMFYASPGKKSFFIVVA
jgi:hypothetical protein